MHSMLVTVGKLELELGLTFGAAREIAQKVDDPLKIAREAAVEAMFSQAGIAHKPGWLPSVENVPMILWIGAKHGGHKDMKLETVQEAVFDHGFIEARDLALGYLAGIVTPAAREKLDDAGGRDAPGE